MWLKLIVYTANDTEGTFSKCLKLLEIIITILITTAETERCSLTLKRIKTVPRNIISQRRLFTLAILLKEIW